MKTSKPTNPDTTIEVWNAARAARDAATTAHQDAHRAAERARSSWQGVEPETRLRVIALNVAALEAEDDEAAARARAVVALGARDVASGDPDALACSLEILAADLEAGLAEAERLRSEAAAAERGALGRLEAARAAHAALAIRRSAANLPEPARVPVSDTSFGEILSRLKVRIEEGATVAPKNGKRIRDLKNEETGIRVHLEKQHRDKEAAKAHDKAAAEDRERERVRREKANAAETAALRAKYAAEAKARVDMANAHKARAGT